MGKKCNIKCEHPVIIFNHDIIYLMSVKKCAVHFRGCCIEPHFETNHEYMIPWTVLYSWKSQVDVDTISDGFLVDNDGVHYPLFLLVPCGKCKLCKFGQREDWITRCMCESAVSRYPPLFITLTWMSSKRPKTMEDAKYQFQLFMKRLREQTARKLKTSERELRYVAVSEWTPKHHYPHIHMMLWNMPFVHFHQGDKSFYQLRDFIQYECWQNGYCKVLPARDPSGRYTFKYMAKVDDPAQQDCWRLASRRHGIGFGYIGKYLLDDFHKNPDMMYFKVADGKGGLVTRPLPQYFKRLLCPSLSQLFPAKIIRGLKDFRSTAAELLYYFQLSGKDAHQRSLELMYQDLSDKYYYLHFPWSDAAPRKEWRSDVLNYVQFENAKKHPLRLDFSDPTPDLPFDSPYEREPILYKPLNLSIELERKLRFVRSDLIQKYDLVRDLYRLLYDYDFDPYDIESAIELKDRRNSCLLYLSKDFKQYDIDNEVYLVDKDRDWIETHWMQKEIG